MAKPKKIPNHLRVPELKKVAKQGVVLDYSSTPVSWRLGTMDKGGAWSCMGIPADLLWDLVHARLKNFETMTIQEITAAGSHSVPVSNLIPEAQARLKEIKLGLQEELFSLRLQGEERVWAIQDHTVLKILWWDPKHQVCPSPKKHT